MSSSGGQPTVPMTLAGTQDVPALHVTGVAGSSNLVFIETPVNTGQVPLFIQDSGSGLFLFQVDRFGDGTFGGIVACALTRWNGGNPQAAHTANFTATTLQECYHGVFDCTAGPLVFDLGANAAAGMMMWAKKVDNTVNSLTVQATGGGTFDGAANIVLNTAHAAVVLYCWQTPNWTIIAQH